MTEVVDYAASKAKAHTAYYAEINGKKKRVPGCTTITGVMDKPALVRWANRIGLAGIEVTKYVDELASIGTLAHWMVEQHVKGIEIDRTELERHWTGSQIDMAETGYIKFMEWEQDVGFECIESEMKLVSKELMFGGTCDLYGVMKKRNDKKVLCDLKTCKGIFDEHITQVAGYDIALTENGHERDGCMILRIGRNDDEGFETKYIHPSELELHHKRFRICRELYEINKEIKKSN